MKLGPELRNRLGLVFALLVATMNPSNMAWSQDSGSQKDVPASEIPSSSAGGHLNLPVTDSEGNHKEGLPNILLDFSQDQKHIWTSPSRIRLKDATWLVPLGGLMAGLLATDSGYSASLSQKSSTINHYKTISNLGVGSLVAAGAGMYLFSFPTHREHWRETGWLAGEAALNSLVVTEAFKYSLARQRPYQSDGTGSFFHSGGTSFPSEHAAAAWSIAGVIAHEYPGVLPKVLAYGAAAAVDFSRVHARQHFPSDVLIGSVLGYLVAQSVYTRRHQPEIGGRGWEPPSEFVSEEKSHSPAYMGSPYVPLDSWIYPALERLAAMGYVGTASVGLRPWTRLECARLVSEAGERGADGDSPPQVQQFYAALSEEFGHEFELMGGERNLHTQVESVYTRSIGISGKPLTDNYHFGQTVLNDYGRPYEEGFNAVAGGSGWAAAGPFVAYARGEYQSAPSAPAQPAAVLDFISSIDGLPANPPSLPVAGISRLRWLDAYVAMNLANWQISYGKQSLWWGPSESGPMLFTNGAEPINNMFRINRVSPFRLPWLFRYFGYIRAELFLGQLSGQQFINNTKFGTGVIGQYGQTLNPQPFVSGGKISFKFTQNLEFNMSKTSVYGGPGTPLTPTTFFKSFFGGHQNGEALGDGRSAWDFSYRVPKIRDWLTVFGDVFEEDEPFPINHLGKAAFQGGLYIPKVPKVRKLDLRLEGGSTSPVGFPTCNGCYYSNFQYVSGYTSNGQLMGTWLGRAAQGESIWSNYWLSPAKRIGIELKHRKVDRQFLPQGGTQNDVALNADFLMKLGLRVTGTVQYESWQIPLLAASRRSNVTASFQVGYLPRIQKD